MFSDQIEDILSNASTYHDVYYKSETFSGPSLYFHRKCIESINSANWERYLEYIFATLSAWGMHRMGKGGSKMNEFGTFMESVTSLKKEILQARSFSYKNLSLREWEIIEQIFYNIDVMASKTSLVGNSKVMAHLLPNLIPPIDRRYTLQYLYKNTNIQNDMAKEWSKVKCILSEFFYPLACNVSLEEKLIMWNTSQDKYRWDTSPLKIIDNLIIGSFKTNK